MKSFLVPVALILTLTISHAGEQRDAEAEKLRMSLEAALRGFSKADTFTGETTFTEETTFTNGIGQKMIWVAAGSFRMGDLTGDGEDDEKSVRTVELSGYHLASTEVTQEQWQKVMGTSLLDQQNKSPERGGNLRGEGPDHPIYYVNWNEAIEFCKKLTEIERRAGKLPKGCAYVLPTEAQWEYACRAGSEGKYAVGDLDAMAWYAENSEGEAHPVGKKKPNAWGFHDLHGNVWEWCLDWYQDSYEGLGVRDPTGPDSGSHRVNRGGSWYLSAFYCRASIRFWYKPDSRDDDRGFRVALSSRREP